MPRRRAAASTRGRSLRATPFGAATGTIGARPVAARGSVGRGGPEDGHAERRRSDRREPDLVHAQRAGHRHGDAARAGRPPAGQLFTQQRQPGKQTFRFTATGVPDGRYEIVLTATDGRATVTAVVPVLVDRTVRGFAGGPAVGLSERRRRPDELTSAFELTRAAARSSSISRARARRWRRSTRPTCCPVRRR